MAEELHWMPFFGDAFYGSEAVQLMDDAALVCYIRLLWFQWEKGSIPADPKDLAKICGRSLPAFKRIWSQIGSRFVPSDEPGRLVNPVNARIKAEQQEKIAVNRDRATKAGLASAAKRKGQQALPETDARGNESATQVEHKPNTSATQVELKQNLASTELEDRYISISSPLRADARAPSPQEPGREENSSLCLAFGGPPPKHAAPIASIVRDDAEGQEWVSADGKRWERFSGVTEQIRGKVAA